MRRGEIWTVAGGGDCTGKPRPVLIVQDRFDATDSVTVCPLTSDPTEAPLFRVEVEPTEINGLDASSRVMADKVTALRRAWLGERLGRLDDEDMVRVARALLVFLGIAGRGTRRGAPGLTATQLPLGLPPCLRLRHPGLVSTLRREC